MPLSDDEASALVGTVLRNGLTVIAAPPHREPVEYALSNTERVFLVERRGGTWEHDVVHSHLREARLLELLPKANA